MTCATFCELDHSIPAHPMRPIFASALQQLMGLGIGVAEVFDDRWPFRCVRFRVKTAEHVVALTLDDGPDECVTRKVLEILSKHEARATFFLIGSRAQGQESVLDDVAAGGHELANHTWCDEGGFRLSRTEFRKSLCRTHRVLEKYEPCLFRPGGGLWRPSMIKTARCLGYTACVLPSIYPQDLRVSSTSWIAKAVLRWVEPGAIIVLHEGPGRERVVCILDEVLAGLRGRYEVTTASDLLTRSTATSSPRPTV